MDNLQEEIKLLEATQPSVNSVWKQKCLDLFEVCQMLKQENRELRFKCSEVII